MIYLLHRPATIVDSRWFCRGTATTAMVGAAALTLLILRASGNRWIVRPLNRLADQGGRLLTERAPRKSASRCSWSRWDSSSSSWPARLSPIPDERRHFARMREADAYSRQGISSARNFRSRKAGR